jgi:hypothetical protein
MLTFTKTLLDTVIRIQSGHIKIPDYAREYNPPSLLAYYETLPSWARNHPIIKNAFVAYEHHKPNVGLK